jgi:hypothetical protein
MNPNFAAYGLTRAGQQNRNDALTPAIYQRLKKTIDGITGGFGTSLKPQSLRFLKKGLPWRQYVDMGRLKQYLVLNFLHR